MNRPPALERVNKQLVLKIHLFMCVYVYMSVDGIFNSCMYYFDDIWIWLCE